MAHLQPGCPSSVGLGLGRGWSLGSVEGEGWEGRGKLGSRLGNGPRVGAGGGWVRPFLSPGLQGRLGGPGSWLHRSQVDLGAREAKTAPWEPWAVERRPLVHTERRLSLGTQSQGPVTQGRGEWHGHIIPRFWPLWALTHAGCDGARAYSYTQPPALQRLDSTTV